MAPPVPLRTATGASLRRLRRLPPGTTDYPGHGDPTMIGAERGWLAEVPSGKS